MTAASTVRIPPPRTALNWLAARADRLVLFLSAHAFAVALALILGLRYRVRMSHNNGIAAVGRARILDDPRRPEHEFFRPGREFPCRIRHASVSFLDDAMRAVRSISIKFADTDFESPFDLELNGGRVALFWSAASFFRFAKYKRTRHGIQYPEYYARYPSGARGAMDGLRRNPTSFTNLRYYTQTVFHFIGIDGVVRYAKYRVVPWEDVPESGLLDEAEHLIPPENQRMLPGETRSRNYLKEAYAREVRERGARYRLQVQIHTASPLDDPEIFNCCAEWEEDTHPWLDVASIEVDRTLSWKESCVLSFSLNNLPKGLGVIPAKSIYDYNSLNYMRAHSGLARRCRLLAYRIFGLPDEIPDNDDRNRDWAK